MPLLLFENQVFAHSIKKRFQRKRSCKEEKWMSQYLKVLLEIRMRHQKRVDVQQLKLTLKKSWNPSNLKVPFRHLETQHENVQKRKGEILTEPEAVKRLKSEMMTTEKQKVAKKVRLAPDLREKKLQVGNGRMLEMQSKLGKNVRA